MKRSFATIVALVAVTAPLAACGDDPAEPAAAATTEAGTPDGADDALPSERTVIDVRTPEEYDAGHVVDATLIDVSAPDFDERVAELDPDGEYLVYCRSGNRSAQAAERMRAAGLDVEDGGGLEDVLAAGWPFTG